MADEIEILTKNAASDSWVDLIPNAVSTGYQAQNTNISANRNGIDMSSVTWDGGASEIVFSISGVMDENGIPFVTKSEARASLGGAGTYYVRLIAGSTSLLRSVSLVTTPGTYDATKNGFYEAGDRVLDWVVYWTGSGSPTIVRRMGFSSGIFSTLGIFTKAYINSGIGDGSGAKLQVNGDQSFLTGGITWKTGTSSDVVFLRINSDAFTDKGNYGFSFKYAGAGSGDNNDFQILSDNLLATTQVNALTIKQSGNVLLNTATDNGSGAKLQVNGAISVKGNLNNPYTTSASFVAKNQIIHGVGTGEPQLTFIRDDLAIAAGNVLGALYFNGLDSGESIGASIKGIANLTWGGTSGANIALEPVNGSVLINTTTDDGSGAKLQVLNTATGASGIGLSVTSDSYSIKTKARTPSSVSGLAMYDSTNVFQGAIGKLDPSSNVIYVYSSNDVLSLNGAGGGNPVVINTTTDDGSGAKLQVNGGISTDGTALRTKTIPLGSWDMLNTTFIQVNHGLSDISKIKNIEVQIFNDSLAGGIGPDLLYTLTTIDGGYVRWVTDVYVELRAGTGTFNSNEFNELSFNRGYMTITYEV